MNTGTRPYTDEEIPQLISELKTPRDKTLLTLGVKTGFRISELLSIKIEHLLEYDALKGSITVSKSNTKGKVASRCIPLSEELQGILKAYLNTLPKEQIYLFESQRGKRLSRIQAWRILKEAANSLQLKGKIATHSSRKFFAEKVYKKLEKDIVKLQHAMGHRSLNSTVKYISFLQTEIDDAIKGI